MEKPLVNKKYKLEKFPGKGGWTYTVISEIPPDRRERFGKVKVKGFIDDYEIKNFNLLPMANGKLFLPVKAEIRKKIKKQGGDWVKITLFADSDPLHIPDEFLLCLRDEPAAYKTFYDLSESNKKYYIDWIYSSKREETRVDRIARAIEELRDKPR
jgi:Bacteriocin-protection, YdeI or OmpD-Associated/Domain of unknown function (DUF1905)